MTQLRIAMCCDFFYPRLGGVEMHIWSLAQCLLAKGHHVVVVTHCVPGGRSGIRYMTNGLKVYYLPLLSMVDNVILPTFISGFHLFRILLIRENIRIVHGHQATSTLMHECLLQAKTMGYKTVYTDHSLFGFADAASVHLNKVMKFTLSNIDHMISVSNTCKENLTLRASVSPGKISVIPNAVDATKFTPDLSKRPKDKDVINVVVVSRLVYRKGIDLVVKTIQLVCERFDNVNFIIGGDGNKKILLEEMVEKYCLESRVELLGALEHKDVRNVLCRGHIFLNSSLTESFCIAILEAASCGLYIVSTSVGGVPEVLPSDMICFSKDTTPEALCEALCSSFPLILGGINKDPAHFHRRVAEMYNWEMVASRTAVIYKKVIKLPDSDLINRFRRYYGLGPFAGVLGCLLAAGLYLYLYLLEYIKPKYDIERAVDFPQSKYEHLKLKKREYAKAQKIGNIKK